MKYRYEHYVPNSSPKSIGSIYSFEPSTDKLCHLNFAQNSCHLLAKSIYSSAIASGQFISAAVWYEPKTWIIAFSSLFFARRQHFNFQHLSVVMTHPSFKHAHEMLTNTPTKKNKTPRADDTLCKY